MSCPSSVLSASSATVVIGGTIAIDHVKTPDAEASGLLGGSAAYAALAASFFCRPVGLIGIIGRDFPQAHLDMLESRGISLAGVERSDHESFTWSGEYHANMNERTTHRVGLNVLEDWRVKVPAAAAASTIVVLANMSPDNQLEMLAQCGIVDCGLRIEDSSPLPSSNPKSKIQNQKSSSSSNPKFKIQNSKSSSSSPAPRFVIADTMDLWIEIANQRLHEVLPHLDLFVLNEGEARDLAGTSNLVRAGRLLLAKGPRHVVIKLGEFGAMLFSALPSHSASACEHSPMGLMGNMGDMGDMGSSGADSSALPSSNQKSKIKNQKSSSSSSAHPSPIHDPQSTSASECAIFRCSAWPLEEVADPTGAGDTFLGAIAGYLAAQGPPPYAAAALRQAIIQGSILASFTCEAFSTRRLEALTSAELAQRLDHFRQATLW